MNKDRNMLPWWAREEYIHVTDVVGGVLSYVCCMGIVKHSLSCLVIGLTLTAVAGAWKALMRTPGVSLVDKFDMLSESDISQERLFECVCEQYILCAISAGFLYLFLKMVC